MIHTPVRSAKITTMGPGALGTLAKKKLKLFRYYPPLGGFGGDWDSLDAQLTFESAAAFDHAASLIGFTGMGAITGVRVDVSLNRESRTIRLCAGMYITPENIQQAVRVEEWLEQQGINCIEPLSSQR